jgi:hypothetical protein
LNGALSNELISCSVQRSNCLAAQLLNIIKPTAAMPARRFCWRFDGWPGTNKRLTTKYQGTNTIPALKGVIFFLPKR